MVSYRFFIIQILFLSLTISITLNSTNARAEEKQCYKTPQFEAEQGLRIHSELLVISLTCQKTPGYSELYPKYQRFTEKNKLLLSGYENNLVNFYKDNGSTQPAKELHSLRTSLANEISQHAINMSTKSFCTYFGKRLDRALNMNKKTLKRWARQIWDEQKTSYKLCPYDKDVLAKETEARKKRRQAFIKQQKNRR